MKKPAEPGDGRSLNRVKGTAKIKVPPFFILSYIGDFEKSKKWNEMFDHGRTNMQTHKWTYRLKINEEQRK